MRCKQKFDWGFAQVRQLYDRIPMKGASILPDEGFPARVVDVSSGRRRAGPLMMEVYCLPKPAPGKRWGHRVLVKCACGRDVPIGRMVSHAPACQSFQAIHVQGD